jgi:hypothetical protein
MHGIGEKLSLGQRWSQAFCVLLALCGKCLHLKSKAHTWSWADVNLLKEANLIWAWCARVLSSLWMTRQEGHKFEVSLGYINSPQKKVNVKLDSFKYKITQELLGRNRSQAIPVCSFYR